MDPDAAQSLRNARFELEQVGRLLRNPSPHGLDICEQRLAKVVEALEGSHPLWQEAVGNTEVLAEALSVRRMLTLSKRLLDKAALFYAGWRRIRAGIEGQYRADGSFGEIAYRTRILIQG